MKKDKPPEQKSCIGKVKQQALDELKTKCTKMVLENPHIPVGLMITDTLKKKGFSETTTGIDYVQAGCSLKSLAKKVVDGDIAPVEEILFSQLKFLEQLLFVEQGMMNSQTQIPHHLSMGYFMLKVQEQARKTAATLAAIKQGPRQTIFVKQQNQAVNQQVNNSEKKSNDLKNELLEVLHDVDGGTQAETVRSYPALETVVVEYRTKDGER